MSSPGRCLREGRKIRNVVRDERASAAPIIGAVVLIFFIGLAWAVAISMLEPFVTTTLDVDWLMWTTFKAGPIVVLFVVGSGVIIKAQRGE